MPVTHKADTNLQNAFSQIANHFLESTEHLVRGEANPGGYYNAIWCRDASYILKDWFLSGRFQDVMQVLLHIWSHQIRLEGEKIIYGRGSPKVNYSSQIASTGTQNQFKGALPTTIFYGFSEVYGLNPDIDSTALMVSTTSWIFDACLRSGVVLLEDPPPFSCSHASRQDLKKNEASMVFKPSKAVIDFIIPKMLGAIDYLENRDIDGDGLLEQGNNEDWMDTTQRAGKIVYSQASWILALRNLSSLLSGFGRNNEADRLLELANKNMQGVEEQLWIEKEGTYNDVQESDHIIGSDRMLTQDISLYLVAITENMSVDHGAHSVESEPKIAGLQNKHEQEINPKLADRANRTLDSIKYRMWEDNWPGVTEKTLHPWVIHPNMYHSHTFWPWSTGLEMLARSRFGRMEECNILLSVLTSKNEEGSLNAFYEWVDLITHIGKGAFPFKTGISALRIAISDILYRGFNPGVRSR